MNDSTRVEIGWSKPNQIDGTPDEVREAVVNQLRDVARAVGGLVEESSRQIRSADLSIILSRPGPRQRNAVIEWEKSGDGAAVADLKAKTAAWIRAVARLL